MQKKSESCLASWTKHEVITTTNCSSYRDNKDLCLWKPMIIKKFYFMNMLNSGNHTFMKASIKMRVSTIHSSKLFIQN